MRWFRNVVGCVVLGATACSLTTSLDGLGGGGGSGGGSSRGVGEGGVVEGGSSGADVSREAGGRFCLSLPAPATHLSVAAGDLVTFANGAPEVGFQIEGNGAVNRA